ncbi:MAG: diguanylate cyclase [Actinomycetota bacterium]|nr:diguanylate cyclase [Actinomycetota bacterium]
MSLRIRLTVYFSIMVMLPLTVAAVAARAVLIRELETRATDQLTLGLQSVLEQVELVRERAGDLAEDLAARERALGAALSDGDAAAVRAAVESAFGGRGRADVVVVTDEGGAVLAARTEPAQVLADVEVPDEATLAAAATQGRTTPFVVGRARVVEDAGGRTLGWILAGRWVDRRLAEELSGSRFDLTLFVDEQPVATTTGADLAGTDAGRSPAEIVAATLDQAIVQSVAVDDWSIVASSSREPIGAARRWVTLATIAILAVVALTAAALGWLVAQVVVQPVRELAAAARDVASGDLDRRIDVRGRDELAVLGAAFNAMTDNLRGQVQELERSRDALQDSLDRLGQTLSSTLDLNRTLAAVVEAASAALTAERAALFMLAPGRSELYVKVARGLAPDEVDRTVAMGSGVVGWVAQTASVVRLPQDADEVPAPDPGEPTADALLAVPLFSPELGQLIGVLVLYDRADGAPFDAADLYTLRSFAAQASVAIENVRLHQATQQASITDGLTGLWNLRYFRQRAEEEVERAARFGHDLAMIILDIDHFKAVNDRYGHPVGDTVLIEVAQRVSAQVREVDTVARYGGEEFVLVLPETDLQGAARTAERIRQAVGASPVETEVGDLWVTVSLGVVGTRGSERSVDELLRAADQAMYAAKQAGRDRVVTADEVPPRVASETA